MSAGRLEDASGRIIGEKYSRLSRAMSYDASRVSPRPLENNVVVDATI